MFFNVCEKNREGLAGLVIKKTAVNDGSTKKWFGSQTFMYLVDENFFLRIDTS